MADAVAGYAGRARWDVVARVVLGLVAAVLGPMAASGKMVGVAAGKIHSCAVDDDGRVFCWGNQLGHRLGTRDTPKPLPEAVQVKGLDQVTQLAAGQASTCARVESGQVKCWGHNGYRRLGRKTENPREPEPRPVEGLEGAVRVSVGVATACAVLEGGELRCWGSNRHGALGNGKQADGKSGEGFPPAGVESLGAVVDVAVGDGHVCAATRKGGVFCWGRNDRGQLGRAEPRSSATPLPVAGIGDAKRLAAGRRHTCAVLASGAVTCWGDDEGLQLGPKGAQPVAVPGVKDAVEVAAGWSHSCARTKTGAVLCWGTDLAAQLGDGRGGGPNARGEAQRVMRVDDAVSISAGMRHTCAALGEGGVMCWGADRSGQLGDGILAEPDNSPIPGYVTGLP